MYTVFAPYKGLYVSLWWDFILSYLHFINLITMVHPTKDGICPTPVPCHCISDQVIYCAYKRLKTLPYFLDFSKEWDELNVAENLLNTLDKNGLIGVKVKRLRLERNIIRSIEIGAFDGISGLESLDLSHNNLKKIPEGVLDPLSELRSLRIQYNELSSIEDNAFLKTPHLRELDVYGNAFTTVPSKAISRLRDLRVLILRNNKLRAVGSRAFHGLPLERLDLGENIVPLTINRDTFCGLESDLLHSKSNERNWTGLTTLLLDHNGISQLDFCITRYLWTLKLLDISGNPLDCSCSLLLLREIRGSSDTRFPRAQCATPPRLAGKYLEELTPLTMPGCDIDNAAGSCSVCHKPATSVQSSIISSLAPVPGAHKIQIFISIILLCMLMCPSLYDH